MANDSYGFDERSVKRIADTVRRSERDGSDLTGTPARGRIRPQETLWGRITDYDADQDCYAWEEVRRNEESGEWEHPDDWRTGTPPTEDSDDTQPAVSANPDAFLIDGGTVVLLRRSEKLVPAPEPDEGEDPEPDTYVTEWVIVPPTPVGQYQFQVFQTVAQNTMGMDYVRAHSFEGGS